MDWKKKTLVPKDLCKVLYWFYDHATAVTVATVGSFPGVGSLWVEGEGWSVTDHGNKVQIGPAGHSVGGSPPGMGFVPTDKGWALIMAANAGCDWAPAELDKVSPCGLTNRELLDGWV